jgi:tetratricopeptide (TPR) repeat protein
VKKYDFKRKDAWLIFRFDTQVQSQPVDIYMIMDLPSEIILAHEIVETELSPIQAFNLFKTAQVSKGNYPPCIILAPGDPAEKYLKELSTDLQIDFESIPAVYLEPLLDPLKRSFSQNFFSTTTVGYERQEDERDKLDGESIKNFLPDNYDPCSCASGKKYKFCCRRILREITGAMVAAKDGKFLEALKWMDKARAIVGETAEILCRESIVYSYFNSQKSEEILSKCLVINPNHPRAHYIRGIDFKEKGDFTSAILAYKTAIQNYPPSDHYHLNEAYNNLGSLFYDIGDFTNAKESWEKALLFMPFDEVVRQNLSELIYSRPISQ